MVACKVLGLDFDKKGKWVCGDQSWQKELIGDGLALIHSMGSSFRVLENKVIQKDSSPLFSTCHPNSKNPCVLACPIYHDVMIWRLYKQPYG
jgi:hypothetical protein